MSSALRTRRYAGSNLVRKANHQRVGESGRPYLRWKQGIVCSNHTTLTIVIDPWRNRNAAVCKTVMSRGGTGRVIQDKQIARPSIEQPGELGLVPKYRCHEKDLHPGPSLGTTLIAARYSNGAINFGKPRRSERSKCPVSYSVNWRGLALAATRDATSRRCSGEPVPGPRR